MGVNQAHQDSCKFGFIFDKLAELIERPRVVLPPLAFANRCSGADATEVFHGNPSSSVFSLCNYALGDCVVDMCDKTRLLCRTLLKQSLGSLRAFGLELAPKLGMALPQTINLPARVKLAVRISSYIHNAKVYAKKSFRVISIWLRDIHNHSKVECFVSQDKVGLFNNRIYSGSLIGANPDGDNLPAFQGEYGYFVQALERKDAAIVDHGRMGLEEMLDRFVSPVATDHFTYNPDSHLCRQTIMLPQVAICEAMQFDLASRVILKGKPRDIVAGFVEAFHSFKEHLKLLWSRCQFNHQCLFHRPNYSIYGSICQVYRKEFCRIPLSPKGNSLLRLRL